MKFKTHNDQPINDHLTMLKGTIQASRKQIIQAFGQCRQGSSSRVAHDWKLEFEDGTVATIYDWQSEPTPEDETYNWRIGGKSNRAVELVHQAFRLAHDLRARSAA